MSIETLKAPDEVSILARILSNDEGKLSTKMAQHLLTLGFSESDRKRMHELAQRNQEGDLSANEKDLLLAYVKTGTMLSILKSRARRALTKKKPTSKS